MKINWQKYVDQIYSITYVHNKQRKLDLNEELKRVDIFDSNIYMNIEQIPSLFYDDLLNNFKDQTFGIGKIPSYFNGVMGQYRAIKHAYEAGYENILIIEDDVRFFKDKNRIVQSLEYLNIFYQYQDSPSIFCGAASISGINDVDAGKDDYEFPLYHLSYNSALFASNAFNIYNRKAMKYFIDYFESYNFSLMDQYNIIYDESVNFFILSKHICIQQDWLYLMYNTCKDYNIFKPSLEEFEQKRNYGQTFGRDINKICDYIKTIFNL